MTIKDLSEPEICGLQAIFPDIIKSAAPIPANTLKKLLTIINDEQELRRRIDERAKFGDWVKSTAEQIQKEQPTNEIKVGDIVRVKRETPSDLYNNLPYDMPFFVAEIERDCDNPMNDTFFLRNGKTCLNIHPHWLGKWDATKSKDNTITIPVKADFGDTYWDAYRAELVKGIVISVANEETITSPTAADCITDFATQIVDNLKKQSE